MNLALFLIPIAILSNDKVIGHPKPFESELLKSPLQLQGPCKNIKIVESHTKLKKLNKKLLTATCSIFVDSFYKFIKKKGYKFTRAEPRYNISLLSDGRNYRQLNDNKYRFINRPKFCSYDARICKKGEKPLLLNGHIDYDNHHIYIRDDMFVNKQINWDFIDSYMHELFHAFSYASGIHDQHENWEQDDEVLVREFLDEVL